MPDIVLNLNCSEHSIYSRILCGCIYIVKYGLNSSELFLRRVQKRQAKRLRKKGVNINAKGFEYATAENILYELKILPAPLIPASMYSKLRDLLDVYGEEPRSKLIRETLGNLPHAKLYVLQTLLKTMHLLQMFNEPWTCRCGRTHEGNGLSSTMVALPITSYILRENGRGPGHWFVSWGQQASDVQVVKILISHWEDVCSNEAGSSSNTTEPDIDAVKTWYCHLTSGTHQAKAPNEISVSEVENLTAPISFELTKLPGDFDCTLYDPSQSTIPTKSGYNLLDNYPKYPKEPQSSFSKKFSSMTSLATLDQLFIDNMDNLETLKESLDSVTTVRDRVMKTDVSRKPETLQGDTSKKDDSRKTDNYDRTNTDLSLENSYSSKETADSKRYSMSLVRWILGGRESKDNVWSELELELQPEDQEMKGLARNILAGCGSGSYQMWGDYTPPRHDVTSRTKSLSYWSKLADLSRREIIEGKMRQAVKRAVRKTRDLVEAEMQNRRLLRQEGRHETAVSPKLITPPKKRLDIDSTELDNENTLAESQSTKGLTDLEKLANKLVPIDIAEPKREPVSIYSMDIEVPCRTSERRSVKLYNRRRPRRVETKKLRLHPIELSSPFLPLSQFPDYPTVIEEDRQLGTVQFPVWQEPLVSPFSWTGVEASKSLGKLDTFGCEPPFTTNWSVSNSIALKEDSYLVTSSKWTPTEPICWEGAEAKSMELIGASIWTNDTVSVPEIPPIPKELASHTPPNLSTVIMLSQLFSKSQ